MKRIYLTNNEIALALELVDNAISEEKENVEVDFGRLQNLKILQSTLEGKSKCST